MDVSIDKFNVKKKDSYLLRNNYKQHITGNFHPNLFVLLLLT